MELSIKTDHKEIKHIKTNLPVLSVTYYLGIFSAHGYKPATGFHKFNMADPIWWIYYVGLNIVLLVFIET